MLNLIRNLSIKRLKNMIFELKLNVKFQKAKRYRNQKIKRKFINEIILDFKNRNYY